MADLRTESVDGFFGAFSPAQLVAELGQPQEIQRRNRARGRFRTVVVLLYPEKNRRITTGAAEVATSLFVPKEPVLRFLERDRKLKPAHIEGSFIKIKQPLNDKRIIIRETLDLTSAFPIV